jgi:proline iminopeptidase
MIRPGLDPWLDHLERSLEGWNQHVYNAIQGRNEFEVASSLKGWDRWADLPKIKVPT